MERSNTAVAVPQVAHSHLAYLEPDERIRGTYRIHSMQMRRRSDGANFWEVTLADRTGILVTYAWPEQLEIAYPWPRHTRVQVECLTRRFGQKQVADLRSLDPLPEMEPSQGLDLLPRPLCPRPEVLDRFVSLVQGLKNPALRGFVDHVLARDETTLNLLVVPASQVYHHAYFGGLLEHSVEVAEIALRLPYPDDTQREIALVASLFHDIGKTRTFDRSLRRTPAGNLICHDHLTLEICAPGLSWLDMVWPEGGLLLRHVWTAGHSRHGPLPQSALLHAVRLADRLSAEQAKDQAAFARSSPGQSWGRIGRETRWRASAF
ncbi:HD domain-containing protein [Denitratisoma oestradiolicum]|uniref:HD/PDEase domain-containing protein n=1 Tax=Denitratisoma oestradiolicum TaxID=311182 RepID=A0A6S6Y387_9PROT|nr:HD domain-containing protein [Denitratisoma oestradiolicum]CAB1369845.1 conserved protein of unknown function [Denitratisoma oestradiolicum]